MTELAIATPLRTQAIVNAYLVHAKKKLGQNFLIDLKVINGIVAAAKIAPNDQVIEIGPGIGSLTEQLLLAGAKVLAYEVDRDFVPILNNELPKQISGQPLKTRLKIVVKDVLKANFDADFAGFFDPQKPIKVVANLPYYITTPILFFLLYDKRFTSLTLMMQKEVAARLVAQPKSKAFGPLTLAIRTRMKVELALSVQNTSFQPRPKVASSVVVLTPLIPPLVPLEDRHFDQVVKLCFAQRRKTLNNNLKTFVQADSERQQLLTDLNLEPKVRPEALSIAQFIALSARISVKR